MWEIPTLPTEILYQIFEHFCLHCQDKHSVSHEQIISNKKDKDRPALINLSRTCKSWSCVAQNILHHYFKHSDDRHQILFCRTICENPEFSKQLQVAILGLNTGINQELPNKPWFKETMARYSFLFGLEPLYWQSSVAPWGEFIAPIIMLRATNLKHLFVHGLYNPMIFERFRMEAVMRNKALTQKLESLSVGQQEISSIWDVRPPQTYLHTLGGLLIMLENLQALSISRPNFASLPEKLPLQKLRRLRIGNACMSKSGLQRLINNTGKLEEFVYREVDDTGWANATRFRIVTSQEIFEMLLPMKDTLKRVVLKMYTSERPPTAMAQLVKLQQLRANAGVLCDIFTLRNSHQDLAKDALLNVFPPNLQTLCLDHSHTDAPRYREALGSYISSTYREPPEEQRLREVILHFIDKAYPNPSPWAMPVVRPTNAEEEELLRRECGSLWLENGCITTTVAPFSWYSCDEVGENTMLPHFSM